MSGSPFSFRQRKPQYLFSEDPRAKSSTYLGKAGKRVVVKDSIVIQTIAVIEAEEKQFCLSDYASAKLFPIISKSVSDSLNYVSLNHTDNVSNTNLI